MIWVRRLKDGHERGDWTIVEEEDYLSVINNKTGKKYKMMLEEIVD